MFTKVNFTDNEHKKQIFCGIKLYGNKLILGKPQLGRNGYVSAESIEWMSKEATKRKCTYGCNNWRKMHGITMMRRYRGVKVGE